MAAYRRVCDSRHLQADCQEPGSAPEPYAQKHVGKNSEYNVRLDSGSKGPQVVTTFPSLRRHSHTRSKHLCRGGGRRWHEFGAGAGFQPPHEIYIVSVSGRLPTCAAITMYVSVHSGISIQSKRPPAETAL